MQQIYVLMGRNSTTEYCYPIACFTDKDKANSFMRLYSKYDDENDNEYDTIWIHESIILK